MIYCKKHPNSGTVYTGTGKMCFGCYCDFPSHDDSKEFWICHVEGTNGGRHHHHFTLPSAEKEAERLAKVTGKAVYLFECIGKCKVDPSPVRWEVFTESY